MSSINVFKLTAEEREPKRPEEFFPTPWEPIFALLGAEAGFDGLGRHDYPRPIWEPACGDGALCEAMSVHGHAVFGSDLIDRGYNGAVIQDYVMCEAFPGPADFFQSYRPAVITNPPFTLAEEFIRKSMALGCDYVAMLLKANFFHTANRIRLFNDYVPARVYPMAWRIDFTGQGGNHFDCAWFVWDRVTQPGKTLYMPPLVKPKFTNQEDLF